MTPHDVHRAVLLTIITLTPTTIIALTPLTIITPTTRRSRLSEPRSAFEVTTMITTTITKTTMTMVTAVPSTSR